MFEVALLVGGAAVVILELGSQLAIDVLAGPEFAPAVDILRIQAPAALATFAAVACAYPLLSLHRHREVLIACSVGLVVTFAALFALVPPFEGEGAGAATLLAEIGVAVTMAALLVRSHEGLKLPLGHARVGAGRDGAGARPALRPRAARRARRGARTGCLRG